MMRCKRCEKLIEGLTSLLISWLLQSGDKWFLVKTLTFGKRRKSCCGGWVCPVFVNGRHEIDLIKDEGRYQWFTHGTNPNLLGYRSRHFHGIGSDGVVLGGGLREAQRALRKHHFMERGL